MSALTAVLVVGLLGVTFFSLARTRGINEPASATPGTLTPATPTQPAQTGCDATGIKGQLPSSTFLTDLAMTSRDEGWAVGGGGSDDNPSALILRYQACRWSPIAETFPQYSLNSVSMASATEGWAVGGNASWPSKPFTLHYTGGAWQPVAISMPAEFTGIFTKVRMFDAADGWILVVHSKNDQGLLSNSLLRYRDGAWTPLAAPLGYIVDIAPVGPDDVWIVGGKDETEQTNSILAHYQSGTWASFAAPKGLMLTHLRANSPTDIYAMGSIPAKSNWEPDATPAILRYDGTTWARLPLPGFGVGDVVEMLSASDGWMFHLATNGGMSTGYHIARIAHLTGSAWRTVSLPANDLVSIKAMSYLPNGSWWAIGTYMVDKDMGNGVIAGYGYAVLLHYSNGTWSQIGR
jgi:hypothetical protein